MLSIDAARSLMGPRNFFGPEEWTRFYGSRVQIPEVPAIPWDEDQIVNSGFDQEQFLCLGLERLGGEPLNLGTWNKKLLESRHPDTRWSESKLEKSFSKTPCGLSWMLMRVGIVPGTLGLGYESQTSKLAKNEHVPSLIERVTANVLYFHLNDEWLDGNHHWARTSSNLWSVVGNNKYGDLHLCESHYNADPDTGLAASRKQ